MYYSTHIAFNEKQFILCQDSRSFLIGKSSTNFFCVWLNHDISGLRVTKRSNNCIYIPYGFVYPWEIPAYCHHLGPFLRTTNTITTTESPAFILAGIFLDLPQSHKDTREKKNLICGLRVYCPPKQYVNRKTNLCVFRTTAIRISLYVLGDLKTERNIVVRIYTWNRISRNLRNIYHDHKGE